MIKNRFHKNTLGVDAEIFVSKAVAYTDDTTFAGFVANAVDGEVGLFNASTQAALTLAATAGTSVFYALKRDGQVITSQPFTVTPANLEKISYVAPVKQVSTITTTAPGSIAKGDLLELVVIETTPNLEPLPRTNYSIEVKAGETYTQAITRLVALINNSTAIENADKTQIVTAAVANTDDITLTAVDFGTHFTVALRGILADTAVHAITTPFKQGSGQPDHVKELEVLGNIRRGVGHYFPAGDGTLTAADFGVPSSLVDANGASAQYQIVKVKYFSEDTTRTLDTEKRLRYVFIVTPSNGAANPTAAVNTVLGL